MALNVLAAMTYSTACVLLTFFFLRGSRRETSFWAFVLLFGVDAGRMIVALVLELENGPPPWPVILLRFGQSGAAWYLLWVLQRKDPHA